MSIEIGRRDKLFNLDEASALLPLIQSLTQQHRLELEPKQTRLTKLLANDPRRGVFEQEYQESVSTWKNKIELLGAKVCGLWIVEFNVGDGAICWRHPELSLHYFRPAGDAFSERVVLQDYIAAYDPDWAS